MNQDAADRHPHPCRTFRTLCFGLLLVLIGFASTTAHAWQSDDELAEDGLARGLVATIEQGEASVQRIDQASSFDWPANQGDRRLQAGPFLGRWQGLLESEARGEYRFALVGQGQAALWINGQVVCEGELTNGHSIESDPLELPFDLHQIEFILESRLGSSRLAIYWQGPTFGWELLPANRLYHDLDDTVDSSWGDAAELVTAGRCRACHQLDGRQDVLPAPSLTRVNGQIDPTWVVNWLSDSGDGSPTHFSRQMPYFEMTTDQAKAITAFLFAQSTSQSTSNEYSETRNSSAATQDVASDLDGRQLFLSLGCLACHQYEDLGQHHPLGGGDLSSIHQKRSQETIRRWLLAPADVNQHHRMPQFDLTFDEADKLSEFLSTSEQPTVDSELEFDDEQVEAGRQLFSQFRCDACHDSGQTDSTDWVSIEVDWEELTAQEVGCLNRSTTSDHPIYRVSETNVRALSTYLQHPSQATQPTMQEFVSMKGCLQCHDRQTTAGLAPLIEQVGELDGQLAGLASALKPPSLTGIGDKLTERSFLEATGTAGVRRRPWLQVRMPRYHFQDDELVELYAYWQALDQMPAELEAELATVDEELVPFSGPRLIGSAGFGCTSCHQVGSVVPPNAPLNALGPNLSMLEQTVRPGWFRRWVANPSRFQPGMEMPSIQLPVHGLLNDDLELQLAAVWQALNQPGFEPPRPEPIRVVRQSGEDWAAPALVLTDVIRRPDETLIKPFVIGLANRHNLLFDAERGRLAGWWLGDVLRQHTEGKTWFWELGGTPLWENQSQQSEWQLSIDGQRIAPSLQGQFVTEVDHWQHRSQGLAFEYALAFQLDTRDALTLRIRETITTMRSNRQQKNGWRRRIEVFGLTPGATLWLSPGVDAVDRETRRSASLSEQPPLQLELLHPSHLSFSDEGSLALRPESDSDSAASVVLTYTTALPTDIVPRLDVPQDPIAPQSLDVVPGFVATRLPFERDWMPTGLAWGPQGVLFVSSLKGRVWRVTDDDGDGWEEQAIPFGDELAAPFGVSAGEGYVDVINKYGLVRLIDRDHDGVSEAAHLVASGWGHTVDYHDWAVGLPKDRAGNYYIALSCQQDQRSLAASQHRGTVLRLRPTGTTDEEVAHFEIERLTEGHRFPIGIALSKDDDLFVTDNQGNYNPFNELNHVVPGRRYGFINAFERQMNIEAPLTEPAVNIPHPWTRSVNGICFLNSPIQPSAHTGFGPFEGHLIGCEYDTRRLVRMTLETVDGVQQGAVYPFSVSPGESSESLLGPLACAVSPTGELYVGSIRDSGWGGANNIGNLVRMKFEPSLLPAGISEVRSHPEGFAISLTRAVDRELAAQKVNYRISSYRRQSTPAYGGDDLDRRVEEVEAVELSDDCLTVVVKLAELRSGFVYQFDLADLDNEVFFPAEAYYTLHKIATE